MKLLLTGEGPTDCGKLDYETQVWKDGPVQGYLRKIVQQLGHDIEIQTVEKEKITEHRKKKRQTAATKGLQGHAKKAFFVMQAAIESGCTAAAMYVDSDKSSGERAPKTQHECEKRYNELKDEVLTGLRAGAGKETVTPIAIIPVKMIECWILGDKGAFERYFGEEQVQRLGNREDFVHPELIWGAKDDPASDYPKNKLERILNRYGEMSGQEIFVALAENADIDAMRTNCPISFGDFFRQVSTACSL